MGASGPKRQIGPKAVLVGILLSINRHKVAHLRSAHEVLMELPVADQTALGVLDHTGDGLKAATYRQLEHTFSEMVRVIDPSPVPSFRGLRADERRARLEAVRQAVDAERASCLLAKVVDLLLEASVPETDRHRRDLAVDWTDHESWARPREQGDPVPSADPDAAWGHAKRNAPGAKDGPFYGYYAQVAVMAADESGCDRPPELIRRVVLKSAGCDPAGEMAALLERTGAAGDVLADCGYSFRAGFGARLRRLGAEPVMDLHPFDRGPKGTFEGAVCANGNLYCPCVPEALVSLGPLGRGASIEEAAAHDRACEELERYRFTRHTGPDTDGFERMMCPAAAGRVRCPLVEPSLTLGFGRPTVSEPPEHPPRCCLQRTGVAPCARFQG
jgi:hypothetical protein